MSETTRNSGSSSLVPPVAILRASLAGIKNEAQYRIDNGGGIAAGLAGLRSPFNTNHSIFAAKTLGSLDARVVQRFQIMLIEPAGMVAHSPEEMDHVNLQGQVLLTASLRTDSGLGYYQCSASTRRL